jgi:hypothetical protein
MLHQCSKLDLRFLHSQLACHRCQRQASVGFTLQRRAAHQVRKVVLAAASPKGAQASAAPLLLRLSLAWAAACLACLVAPSPACLAVPSPACLVVPCLTCLAAPCLVLVAWLAARCLGPGAGPSCPRLLVAWGLLRRVQVGHPAGLVGASGALQLGSLAWEPALRLQGKAGSMVIMMAGG